MIFLFKYLLRELTNYLSIYSFRGVLTFCISKRVYVGVND